MASAFVEIISHFEGYLQIVQDIARDRIDETIAPRPMVDYTTPRSNHDRPITPGDLQGDVGGCYEA